MQTLNVRVQTFGGLKDELLRNLARADTDPAFEAQPTLSFDSWDTMHRILAPKRTQIVMAMAGRGALTVRDVARLVERDIKNVHGDLDMLAKSGVIDKTDGGFVFPYDRIHIEFDMEAAA